MEQEKPSKQDREAVAQILRLRAARGSEAVTTERVASVETAPVAPEPKRHQWDELREISALLWRLGALNHDDRVKKRTAIDRLEEIADSLEDMYEHSRDH